MKNSRLFAIILIICLTNTCGQKGDTSSLDALTASILTKSTTPARSKCIASTIIMNRCVGDGFQLGFNPDNMCSDANIKTEVEYDKLIKCTSAKVSTSNCNFPQNKVGDAKIAYSNFFKSCIKEETLTDGIIVTDWFTITVPKL